MTKAAKATAADVERETIRHALFDISRAHAGVLNPQDVVEAARDDAHPLHGYFTWDDEGAAERFRVLQAGALIRRAKITIVRSDDGPRSVTLETTRAFQSRPTMRHARGGYERIDAILADDTKRHELIAQVLSDLLAYRKRYAHLAELQPVWIGIDDVAAELLPTVDTSAPSDAPVADATHGAAG